MLQLALGQRLAPVYTTEVNTDDALDRIELAARAFVEENPRVWALFVRFTFELIRAGREHYSADAVFHRIRWHTAIETNDDEFKVNNNHVACFARWFDATYPEHVGFFRMRGRHPLEWAT